MNTKHFEETKEIMQKIVNRIINSKTFSKSLSTCFFDDNLVVEHYNSLYKVTFKDVVIGHFHSTDKTNPEYNIFYDELYHAIDERKKKEKEKVLKEL